MTERFWGKGREQEAARQLGLGGDHTIFMMATAIDYIDDINEVLNDFVESGLVEPRDVVEAVQDRTKSVDLPPGIVLVGMRAIGGQTPETFGLVDLCGTWAPGRSRAINAVLEERRRQIDGEGFTPEHDDQHADRSLARAAACYAEQYIGRAWMVDDKSEGLESYQDDETPDNWPWGEGWWKPKDPRRDLVRAAALLIAEIERLDRVAA